jgi:uncharacterized membrane protein YbhN (UPF0104 family)
MPSSSRALPRSRGPWRFLAPGLQVAVSTILLGVILGNAATRADLATLLRAAHPGWFTLAALLAGANVALAIVRWRCVLGILGIPLPPVRVAAIWLIGAFFDLFIFGATGGDFVKALLMLREAPAQKIAAVFSIVLDHLTGILALATAAAIFTLPRAPALLAHPATAVIFWLLIAYLAVCLAALPLLAAIALIPPPAWIRRRPFFREHADEVHLTLRAVLRGWRGILAATGLSFAIWAGHFTVFWCSARAVGADVPARELLAATPISEALVTVPISVAGLGVREQCFQLVLGALSGVPLATAVLISLGGFAAALVWNLAGGLVFAFFRPRRLD